MPFIDLPDQTIENVYYYRWRVAHEAQKYTGAKNGCIVTEFLGPVFYSAPYGGISAAAGHHIAEARWIRDRRYLDDYIRFWLTGDGASAKPANDSVNPNTTDWAHEYLFWAGSAVLQRVEVTGDIGFATDLLPPLITFYNGWSPQFNQQLGLAAKSRKRRKGSEICKVRNLGPGGFWRRFVRNILVDRHKRRKQKIGTQSVPITRNTLQCIMKTYYAIVNVEDRRLGTYVPAANVAAAFVTAAAKYKRRHPLRHVETIAVQEMAGDYVDRRLWRDSMH